MFYKIGPFVLHKAFSWSAFYRELVHSLPKNNYRALRYFFNLIILLLALPLAAQVQPPDFQCTRSEMGAEVLTWVNTTNNCGPFEATEVYQSINIDGPYTLIGELTDPTVNTFSDPNPAGELRFYYLRHRHACSGEPLVSSDTLDNLIPATPQLTYVGLEGDDIVVEWLPSSSPEVTGYVILEQLLSGNVILDTVFNGTRFVLPVQPGDPPAGDRNFLLVAIDPCGNDSPQGRAATPMNLSGTGGFGCTESIDLTIDQAALQTYLPASLLELFVSVNGGAFVSAGTFSPTATTISYNGANDGELLEFYVEAVLAGNRGRARSERFIQAVSFSQPIRDFPLFGAEVNADGEVILQYAGPTVQPVIISATLRITRGSGQTESLDLPGFDFSSGTILTPVLTDPLEPGDELRLRVADECMREVTTNAVMPVFLVAQALFPGQNSLQWTPFVNNLPGSFSYSVARAFVVDEGAVAGAMFEQIAENVSETSLTDAAGSEDGIACYQISVRFLPAEGEPGQSAIFRSNIVCVLPRTEVFVPNAFSPTATQAGNLTFRPRFSTLPSMEGYRLQVIDRWGGLMFETSDPAAGWAGDRNGEPLPAGTFLYLLTYRTQDGQSQQKAGTINLIR